MPDAPVRSHFMPRGAGGPRRHGGLPRNTPGSHYMWWCRIRPATRGPTAPSARISCRVAPAARAGMGDSLDTGRRASSAARRSFCLRTTCPMPTVMRSTALSSTATCRCRATASRACSKSLSTPSRATTSKRSGSSVPAPRPQASSHRTPARSGSPCPRAASPWHGRYSPSRPSPRGGPLSSSRTTSRFSKRRVHASSYGLTQS
jgi:hypothetical protein